MNYIYLRFNAPLQNLIALWVMLLASTFSAVSLATDYSGSYVDCPFANKSGYTADTVQCYELTAHETSPDETFKLSVVILKKSTETAGDNTPIVFIQGGPGAGGIMEIGDWLQSSIREKQDIILFDQRGTGQSSPKFCSELSAEVASIFAQDLTAEQEIKVRSDRTAACLDTLPSVQTVSLFTSRKTAQDINQLRVLLGYETLALYSVSYGTRVALAYAEMFPAFIDSLVLDSPVPPNQPFYQDIPNNFHNALSKLFDACKNSSKCDQRYPNFRGDFYSLVEQLTQDPIKFHSKKNKDNPQEILYFNAQDFLLLMRQQLYGKDFIPTLPLLVDEFSKGNYEQLALLFDAIVIDQAASIDFATYSMVLDNEELSTAGAKVYRQQASDADLKPGLPFFQADFAAFEKTQSIFDETLINIRAQVNVPTLVLAGSYDPMTPASYAQSIAKKIASAKFVELSSTGHAPSFADKCARGLVMKFFRKENLENSTECASKKVEFVTDLVQNNTVYKLFSTVYYDRSIKPFIPVIISVCLYSMIIIWGLWRGLLTVCRRNKRINAPTLSGRSKYLFFIGTSLGITSLIGLLILIVYTALSLGAISLIYGWPQQVYLLVLIISFTLFCTILMSFRFKKILWGDNAVDWPTRCYALGALLANVSFLAFVFRWSFF